MIAGLKVNTGKYDRHVQRLRHVIDYASRAYLRESAAALCMAINASPHEDTGRFKRSFGLAARQIGARAVLVPLKTSSYAMAIRAKVRKDNIKWWQRSKGAIAAVKKTEDRIRGLQRRSTNAVGPSRMSQRIAKAQSTLHKQKERSRKLSIRYDKSFDKLKVVDRAIATGKPIGSIGLRGKREIQIIAKTYGGRGQWLALGAGRFGVNLASLEPHARIVESQYKVLSIARAAVKATSGFSSSGSRYTGRVRGGWNKGAA